MKSRRPLILFVDDDKNFRQVMAYALREKGYDVAEAANGKEALERLRETPPDVILCDLKMPVMGGLELLAALRESGQQAPAIVLTAFGSIESAVEAMRAGAYDYVTKPVNRDALLLALDRALERERLTEENRRLRERVAGGKAVDRLIGATPAMTRLRETLSRLAETSVTVLVRGESGVGKELVARALHYGGPRAATGRFTVLNCASIPHELLESELFGHRKGSFTGALADRVGKFEAADGGTLFLDEIGDMPLDLQAKLLRALQEGEIERIGENEPRRVDVRVVSATNQPLEERIRAGAFREDLFYRLAVVPVEIPPLRERLDDLPLLVRHFLALHGAPGAEAPEETLAALKSHSWPGNVRELENIILRACALRPGLTRLEKDEVAPLVVSGRSGGGMFSGAGDIELPEGGIRFEEMERKLLLAAWEKAGHSQTDGAKLLGLQRQAFIYRLQKFGIIPGYGKNQEENKE